MSDPVEKSETILEDAHSLEEISIKHFKTDYKIYTVIEFPNTDITPLKILPSDCERLASHLQQAAESARNIDN